MKIAYEASASRGLGHATRIYATFSDNGAPPGRWLAAMKIAYEASASRGLGHATRIYATFSDNGAPPGRWLAA